MRLGLLSIDDLQGVVRLDLANIPCSEEANAIDLHPIILAKASSVFFFGGGLALFDAHGSLFFFTSSSLGVASLIK